MNNKRVLLLNFYYEYLKDQGVEFFTIIELNKKYSSDISKCLFDNNLLSVTNVKSPRVFTKELPIEDLIETFFEFSMNIENDKLLNKYNLKGFIDPYSNKDFCLLDFDNLYLHKVIVNNNIEYVILLFGTFENVNFNDNEFIKVENFIYCSIEEDVELNLFKLIDNYHKSFLILNESNHSIYLSNSIKDNYSSNNLILNNEYNQMINKLNLNLQFTKEKLFNSNIYFLNDVSNNKNSIISIESLDSVNNVYTLIISLNNKNLFKSFEKFNNILKTNLFNSYNFYCYKNDLVIYLPYYLSKENKKIIKDNISNIIISSDELNKNVDFVKLLDFLEENGKFNKKEYKDFLFNDLNVNYLIEKEKNNIKDNLVLYNQSILSNVYCYENNSFNYKDEELYNNKLSNYILKKLRDNSLLTLDYRFLKNNILGKKINNQDNVSFVVKNLLIQNERELENCINLFSELIKRNINIIVEYSIIDNIYFNSIKEYISGVYLSNITKERFNNGFILNNITSLLNDSYNLYLDIRNVENKMEFINSINHPNVYYIFYKEDINDQENI